MLIPVLRVAARVPQADWWTSRRGAVPSLALVVVLFVIDSLFNSMPNPLFIAAAGGLAAYPWQGARPRRQPAAAWRPRRQFVPGPRIATAPEKGTGTQ